MDGMYGKWRQWDKVAIQFRGWDDMSEFIT
jgi:hypothetical protein